MLNELSLAFYDLSTNVSGYPDELIDNQDVLAGAQRVHDALLDHGVILQNSVQKEVMDIISTIFERFNYVKRNKPRPEEPS
jgi:hypothetical protein